MLVMKSCSQVPFKKSCRATLIPISMGAGYIFCMLYDSQHLMSNSSVFCFKMVQTHFLNQRLKHDVEIVNKMFVLYILKTSKHVLLLQMQVTQVCLDYRLQDRTWNPLITLRWVLGSFFCITVSWDHS